MKTDEIKKIIKDLWLDFDKVTINKDNSIDYDGNVNIRGRGLDKIPLQFNIVNGDFDCSFNNLTSLKGVPRKCNDFDCHVNQLTSLEYAPIECEYFNCRINRLTSLEYAPIECEIFNCESNKLTSLEYAPEKCEYFYYDNWDSIEKITYKEPAYILKQLKQNRIDLFD